MAVRTEKLAAGRNAVLSTAPFVVYTCPVGKTAIVKEIALSSNSSVTGSAYLSEDGALTQILTHSGAITATSVARLECWTVMAPGDVLLLKKSATAPTLDYWISGTELDGVSA